MPARPFLEIIVLLVAGLMLAGGPRLSTTDAQARDKRDNQGGGVAFARQPALPAPVEEMRAMILEAVRSGRIEDLRAAIQWNELKPDFPEGKPDDPIARLVALSGDGEGREMLAVLGELLELAPAIVPLGRDIENNRLFVWPYLAEADLSRLTPAQHVDLLRLVPPAQAKRMIAAGRYDHWRVAIGAEGTWHAFVKGPSKAAEAKR